MATTDGKPEIKQESKPEAKQESKEVEDNQAPPLKYKAWVLKVSIHCEGCKRKVERTLRKIEGVYEAYADLKQQKATVKANLHVNAETLIKKLVKKGRHAELWPEKAESKEKKQGKPKNKDKQGGQANGEGANNGNHGGDKQKETVKNEVKVQQEDGAKSSENGGGSSKNGEGCSNVSKANDQGGGGAACKNGVQVKEPKTEVKQNVTPVAGNQSSVAEKKGGGSGAGGDTEGNGNGNAGEKSGNGSGSKKNKRKGQKANTDEGGEQHSGDAVPASIESHFKVHGPHGPVPMPSPANHSPPRQHPVYEYPTYYHAPPVYLTSYNTAYPSSSYTASYYTSPPPYSYAYMHPGHTTERQTSDMDMYSSYPSYSSRPSDSFEMFSDENPNACSIM
ncbi:Copper-transporting ATPase 1 [Gossypium arboreum]|uniref:Copper-transporting ATPase 1 n=1 Tax=Gossypium arboreum TaxID=29729 RepID=A0A0B0NQ61_GOSAR|nr:heavy metal-associated isoprenylated plant protein 36 [Gossypium arboreum]KHG13939.1 Copper-transporting ATPase 1 [Gossypium arboreum]